MQLSQLMIWMRYCHLLPFPHITNDHEIVFRFTGATGRAFLFNKVVNLKFSEVQDRVMLTGRHMVRWDLSGNFP